MNITLSCIILLIIILYILLYFSPFFSPYYFKINKLINNNQLQPIENNTKVLNYEYSISNLGYYSFFYFFWS